MTKPYKLTATFNALEDKVTIKWKGKKVMGIRNIHDHFPEVSRMGSHEDVAEYVTEAYRKAATDIIQDFLEVSK